MKKTYESPVAEKIEFRYADQVVASNGGEEGGGEDIGLKTFWSACPTFP